MIIAMIINLIFIIWLYQKYIYTPRTSNQDYKEMEEIDGALIGYIENKWGNSVDWIFAEILELNRKGYIFIDYQKKEGEQLDYTIKKLGGKSISKLKNYELTTYRILFEKSDQITKRELEEKLKSTFEKEENINIKSFSIRNEISEELIKEGIIDENGERFLKIMKRIYMIICIIMLLIFKELNAIQIAIFLIEAFVTLYVCTKGRAFSNKGKILKSKIQEYEEYLLNNKLLSQNKIVDFILQEKDYINSIALHIQSNARDGFIDTEIVDGSAKTTNSFVLNILFIALLFVLYLIMLLT